MNRFFSAMFYLLILITTTHAQNIGIGTTTPDSSAALDISSANKGLLIPRMDLAAAHPAGPATGLMVFNTNPAIGSGTGLYINMGTTAAPQWIQLAPSTSGSFVRNQSSVQAGSNFNISGDGTIGGRLKVSGNTIIPLTVTSSDAGYTGIFLSNSTHPYANWLISTVGRQFGNAGSFWVANINTAVTGLEILPNGSVKTGRDVTAAGSMWAGGDIQAGGNFMMDVKYLSQEHSLPGNNHITIRLNCPAGYQVISGGGGHRDNNSSAYDIKLSYNGPDPAAPSTAWRIMVENTSSKSRAVIIYCNCAKVK